MFFESFKQQIQDCVNEAEIDVLCMEWLKLLCSDHGKEGRYANQLLLLVEDMIDIGK